MEYQKVYTYPDGINSKHFREISRMLLTGMSVEFNCGAGMYGSRESAKNNKAFQDHVSLWVGRIEEHMRENHKFNGKLEYDLCSPNDWRKIRIHSAMLPDTNIKAKRLLSKEY